MAKQTPRPEHLSSTVITQLIRAINSWWLSASLSRSTVTRHYTGSIRVVGRRFGAYLGVRKYGVAFYVERMDKVIQLQPRQRPGGDSVATPDGSQQPLPAPEKD